jgi:hypothetical protein
VVARLVRVCAAIPRLGDRIASVGVDIGDHSIIGGRAVKLGGALELALLRAICATREVHASA